MSGCRPTEPPSNAAIGAASTADISASSVIHKACDPKWGIGDRCGLEVHEDRESLREKAQKEAAWEIEEMGGGAQVRKRAREVAGKVFDRTGYLRGAVNAAIDDYVG